MLEKQTGWAFPVRFDGKGVVTHSGRTNVHDSISMLLKTLPHERPTQPTFGADLEAYLFENLSDSLQSKIETEIRQAIAQAEPRVRVDSVEVRPLRDSREQLAVNVVYTTASGKTDVVNLRAGS